MNRQTSPLPPPQYKQNKFIFWKQLRNEKTPLNVLHQKMVVRLHQCQGCQGHERQSHNRQGNEIGC